MKEDVGLASRPRSHPHTPTGRLCWLLVLLATWSWMVRSVENLAMEDAASKLVTRTHCTLSKPGLAKNKAVSATSPSNEKQERIEK